MELKELQRSWDIFGKEDPLWAILVWEDKKGNNWDLEEFFATGAQEIAEVMRYLADLHLDGPRHRALDFGCGVGRVTQALTSHFAKVTGIDIAPSMIARAQALDFEKRCEFILNDRADLSMFSDNSFDFIYSNIVLQHMRPEYSTAYVREFCRVLVSGGMGVFQLPSRDKPPASKSRGRTLSDHSFRHRYSAGTDTGIEVLWLSTPRRRSRLVPEWRCIPFPRLRFSGLSRRADVVSWTPSKIRRPAKVMRAGGTA